MILKDSMKNKCSFLENQDSLFSNEELIEIIGFTQNKKITRDYKLNKKSYKF